MLLFLFLLVTDSPRIGSFPENFSQVLIKSNDAANGILELSASQLLVSEGTPTSVLSVNRKAGLFGEVFTVLICLLAHPYISIKAYTH